MTGRVVLLVALTACGDSRPSPEVVVADASLGGASPVVLGVNASTVWWTATSSGMTLVGGAPLASLPVTGMQVAAATGPVAAAGDYVVVTSAAGIARVDVSGTSNRVAVTTPDALGGNADAMPLLAWTRGADVSWGRDEAIGSVTLTKVDSCDHVRVAGDQIFVAADGATGRRLLRIDASSSTISSGAASSTWAPMFPGGGDAGATYKGRIVDATDAGALWLVEEMPSTRAVLIDVPINGTPALLLEHVRGATGFFATSDALYWQEGDELLTAPRTGGAASIVTSLPGPAGAVADGYVYYTRGAAIERLALE